jgi:hypothetical protein
MILIFGILSFVVCPIFGVMAWIMGGNDLKEMRAGTMDPSGEQLTNIGKILGMVSCALALVGVCVYAIIIAGVIGGGAAMQPK